MLTSSSNDLQASSYWQKQYSSMAAATTNEESSRRSLWRPSGLGFGFADESALPVAVMDDVTNDKIRGLITNYDDDDGDDDDDIMNMSYIHLEEPQESSSINNTTLPPYSFVNYDITATKKSHHNVKEKLRRMKLNDAYSSLKSLLPDAYKSKKKWSSPVVVARVLEYIPELQEEIKKLRQRKDHMLLSIQKKQILTEDRLLSVSSAPTISTSEINEGEIIAQICVQKNQRSAHDHVFSSLLANVEREGIQIASASTLLISPERVCFYLHLLMKGGFQPTYHVDVLKDKIVSWLSNLIPAGTS